MSTGQIDPSKRHDIPSLNRLRAVSIAIVILSHTKSLLPGTIANQARFGTSSVGRKFTFRRR
jgi:hypothetical protein